MKMRVFIVIMMAFFAISTFLPDHSSADSNFQSKENREFRYIKDLDDKIIEIPAHPKRIASLHGPSYDRILMLGKPSIITLMPMKPSPWTLRMFPNVKDIPVINSYVNVDVEQMLRYKVDLVLFSIYPAQANKLKAAGIRVACPFAERKLPSTMEEFKKHYKRQIMFFGDILGEQSTQQAQKYCEYFDKTINRVLAITNTIPEKNRPRVYYGGLNGDIFSTQGMNTLMHWSVTAAGGNYLTKNYKKHFAKVNAEQLIEWQPEYILIGRKGCFDIITKNPALKNTNAVKKGNVYRIPVGNFWWDLASGESVLLPLFLAKKFHPKLFREWDIVEEMKYFYSEFYGYAISAKSAKRILEALPPQ